MIEILIDWNSNGAFDHALSDVTDRVVSAQWQLGIAGGNTRVPSEGTATITLTNEDKALSPALFDKMVANQRVKISYDGVLFWSGFTKSYAPTPFETKQNTVAIQCEQGIFRLRNIDFEWTLAQNQKAGYVFETLLENILWESATAPFIFRLDRVATVLGTATLVGEDYVLDTAFLLDDSAAVLGTAQLDSYRTFAQLSRGLISSGHHTYEWLGDNWSNTSGANVFSILSEVTNADMGFFLIDRNNLINFYDREYVSLVETATSDIGDDFINVSYQYGNNLANKVYANYYPKRVVEDITVADTTIEIPAQTVITTRIETSVDLEDVTSYTLISLDDFGAGSTWSSIVKDSDPETDNTSALRMELVSYTTNDFTVQITNLTDDVSMVSLVMEADILQSYTGGDVNVEDLDSMNLNQGIYPATLDNNLISTPAQALDNAQYELDWRADTYGEFDNLESKNRSAAWLDIMKEWTLGKLVALTDAQVGETEVKHMIVGESGTFSANNFTMKYRLRRINDGS
jgi:hypothetical protein